MSNNKKAISKIEPNKCIVEDYEVLSFETEEQLIYYTVWHEALVDKRREINAETERERQIIRNEIARKQGFVTTVSPSRRQAGAATSSTSSSHKRPSKSNQSASLSTTTPSPSAAAAAALAEAAAAPSAAAAQSATPSQQQQQGSAAAAQQLRHQIPLAGHQRLLLGPSLTIIQPIPRQGSSALPNGLHILNSTYYNTLPNGKIMMKYKLTKLYNKYRGRQMRRNFVNAKQKNARIEVEISKSYLNSWLAYTALQALRLPESNVNSLNTTTTNCSTILAPMSQPLLAPTTPSLSPSPAPIMSNSNPPKNTYSLSSNSKKQQQAQTQQQPPQQQQPHLQQPQQPAVSSSAPMHLVYMNPGNIITYSNRINPQQVAEYRQKSHLLPSSATSKKSSAASYDVFEIMEVLANTNKSNVTITRNANRSSSSTGSIYSHSVNANTPGIVSTQLHLQARSYLDSMAKFYAEEFERLEREKMEMDKEDPEDLINKYLKVK